MGLAKTMNVASSYSLCTSYMLDKTQQWSAKGNWFNRQVTARAIGMSTSAAMLADAVTHLALFAGKSVWSITTGTAQAAAWISGGKLDVGMSHWNMKEAMVHLAKTVAYIAASVLNLGVAFASPSYQIRGLVATGLSEQPKALRDGVVMHMLKQITSGIKKLSDKAVPTRRVAIGLGVAGAAIGGVALAHRYELITLPIPSGERASALAHKYTFGLVGQPHPLPCLPEDMPPCLPEDMPPCLPEQAPKPPSFWESANIQWERARACYRSLGAHSIL